MLPQLWTIVVGKGDRDLLAETLGSLPLKFLSGVLVDDSPEGQLKPLLPAGWSYLRSQPARGTLGAINLGIEACTLEWLTVLLEGDRWLGTPEWPQQPEVDGWLSRSAEGEAWHGLETRLLRKQLFEQHGLPPAAAGWSALSGWLFYVEQQNAQMAPLKQSWWSSSRRQGLDWSQRAIAMSRAAQGRSYYQGGFAPGGLNLQLRVENPELWAVWSEIWAPYTQEAGENTLTATVYQESEPAWGESPQDGRLTPRQACQGRRTLPGEWPCVYQRPALQCISDGQGQLLACLRAPQELTPTDLGKPLVQLLLQELEARGRQVFHASLLAWQGRGVLLVGPENAGKSSLLLDCLREGWSFVADDLVVMRGDSKMGSGLYAGLWLKPEDVPQEGPWKEAWLGSPQDPKGVLRLSRCLPAAQILREVPIEAVACPVHRPNGSLETTPLQPTRALQVLLGSTLHYQVGGASQAKLEQASALAALPAFRFPLGTPGQNQKRMRHILQ